MTFRRNLFAVALLIAPLTGMVSLPAHASENAAPTNERAVEMEHKFEKALAYYLAYNPGKTGEDFEALRPWLKPLTDVEVMAEVMSDPRTMFQWIEKISNPEAVYLMMKCSQEPVMWDTWITGLSDVDKIGRALSKLLIEPQTYVNWVGAWFDLETYKPMVAMLDPNKYANWAVHSMNPAFYEPMYAFTSPDYYGPRTDWLLDPQTFQPIINAFGLPELVN